MDEIVERLKSLQSQSQVEKKIKVLCIFFIFLLFLDSEKLLFNDLLFFSLDKLLQY